MMKCTACRNRAAAEDSVLCLGCAEQLRAEQRRRESQQQAAANIPQNISARPRSLTGLLTAWLVVCVWLVSVAGANDAQAVPGRAIVPVQLLQGGQTIAGGSAVVFDEGNSPTQGRGWALLTAAHVVQGPQRECPAGKVCGLAAPVQVEVYLGGRWRSAVVRSKSKFADLALLIVTAETDQILTCLASQSPVKGDAVTVAGMSLGLEYQAYGGTVRSPEGVLQELECERSIIPGESGGGVFDAQGDLVGIISSHRSDAPWVCQFVGLVEIRRFVASSWGSLPESLRESPAHGPQPRLAPEVEQKQQVAPPPLPVSPQPQREKLEKIFPPVREQETGGGESAKEPQAVPEVPAIPVEVGVIGDPTKKGPLPIADPPGPPPSPLTSHPSPSPPSSPAPWWDFLTSGVGLGITIAGAVATGGVTAVTVAAPALKFAGALREVVRLHRGRSRTTAVVEPQTVPPGSPGVGTSPAPPRSPWIPQPSTLTARCPAESEGHAIELRAPFPRDLDAASQLLELGKLEGRVPLCDALRGMFLDDELEKLVTSGDSKTLEIVSHLKKSIQSRVDQAAPLSVKV